MVISSIPIFFDWRKLDFVIETIVTMVILFGFDFFLLFREGICRSVAFVLFDAAFFRCASVRLSHVVFLDEDQCSTVFLLYPKNASVKYRPSLIFSGWLENTF